MPRLRADNFEEKKNKILDVAATLFTERGYIRIKWKT